MTEPDTAARPEGGQQTVARDAIRERLGPVLSGSLRSKCVVIAGLGSELLIARYLNQRPNGPVVTRAKIAVAVVDLPLASKIKPEDLTLADWPAEHLPMGAVRDPKELVGRILLSRADAFLRFLRYFAKTTPLNSGTVCEERKKAKKAVIQRDSGCSSGPAFPPG